MLEQRGVSVIAAELHVRVLERQLFGSTVRSESEQAGGATSRVSIVCICGDLCTGRRCGVYLRTGLAEVWAGNRSGS